MDPRARDIIDTWNRLDGDMGMYKTHWQEITNYMHPERRDYVAQLSPGQKRMQFIYDSTPVWALQQFAAGLHSLLTSPTLQWFALKVEDEAIDSMDHVRAWLDAVGVRLYSIFNGPKHNFASQSHEIYLDLGSIGTGVMAVLESRRVDVLFSTRHMKECRVEENEEDRIDQLYRRWEFTAGQAFAQWGAAAGEKVVKAYETKPETKFWFHHAVRPRKDRNPDRRDAMHKPFESIYASESDGATISIKGFDEFPYLAPRLSKVTGEKYGRGLGHIALPDVKMLNELVKITLKSAQKMVDPPLQLPDNGYMVPIKTTPGSLNFYRAGQRPTDRIEPIETKGQVQIGTELIEALRQQIMRTFAVDLLRMPTDLANPNSEGKGTPATYWLQRREKEMMALSPLLARTASEFLDPCIDRVFAMEWRRSVAMGFGPGSPFPPPPPELSNQNLRAQYVSPIAIAQRSSQLDAVGQLMDQQLRLRQIDPKAPMILNSEGIMRLTGRDLNAPASALKTPEQLEAEQQAAQEAEQAMQQHMQAASLAKTAKDGTGAIKNLADASATQQEAA